jgi:hypothetical protein
MCDETDEDEMTDPVLFEQLLKIRVGTESDIPGRASVPYQRRMNRGTLPK